MFLKYKVTEYERVPKYTNPVYIPHIPCHVSGPAT